MLFPILARRRRQPHRQSIFDPWSRTECFSYILPSNGGGEASDS